MKEKKKGVFWVKNLAVFIAVLTLVASCIILKNTGAYSVYTLATKNRDLPIYCVGEKENEIAISFDCAWGVDYTDKILDTLDFYKVKCTFFATQFWVEKYPDYVKKINERGHEIGTHSRTHSYMSKMGEGEIVDELKTSSSAIEKITGKKVSLFRPPYGDYDDLLVVTARGKGLHTIQWDVDSLDWKDLSAEQIANRVIKKVKAGSIILCHNNGLHTADALPLIFTDLLQKGYVFQPIGELIYKNDYRVDASGRQFLNEN